MNAPQLIEVCAWCSPEIKGPNITHTICAAHKHAQLVDRVMVVHGRASSDPQTYRRVLELMSDTTLIRSLEDHHFPAASLTETAGVIASTDKGESPAPRGKTLQTALEILS